MVAYDYKCSKCGVIKEINHGMMENPSIVCSECGTDMYKVIRPTAIKYGSDMTQNIRI